MAEWARGTPLGHAFACQGREKERETEVGAADLGISGLWGWHAQKALPSLLNAMNALTKVMRGQEVDGIWRLNAPIHQQGAEDPGQKTDAVSMGLEP